MTTNSDPYFFAPPAAAPAPVTPAPMASPDGQWRRPGPGECQACGCTPAAPTQFKRQTGMLLMSRQWTERATYCKGCARAAFRRCQDWCLTKGWWGFIATILNLGWLAANAKQMSRLATMPDANARDPWVVTPSQQPSNGGSPLAARAGVWVTVALALVVLATVVF